MVFKANIALCAALFSLAVPVVRSVEVPVTVGGSAGLVFSPSSVTANIGDVVIFSFRQKNHTATQSSFENPCVQTPGGFDSGFIPVPDTNQAGPFPAAQFTVRDTNPVWVFCRQAGHCQQGMVFAINPGDQFQAFQNAAKGITTTTAAATTATDPAGISSATATITDSAGQAVTTTYASFPGSVSPTSPVSTGHLVVVGGPGRLIYSPSNITAQVGDTVTFQFMQKNHTVTQSTFAAPCNALTSTSTSGQIGFDSGFMPVADSATTFPTFTIQVNDTAPIWAYCRQATHCGSGMVFSVNAVESGPNNFAAFKAKAMALNGTGSPTSSGSGSRPTNGASVPSTTHAGVMLALVAAIVGSIL